MIGGTLNMKPKRSMVRAAFVSLLIAGMLVAGVAGAEDNEIPRSSVLTTGVDEVRPVPVPKRKLSSKSSNVSNDDRLSDEAKGLLRALVIDKAMGLFRFSMQESQSLKIVGFGRELIDFESEFDDAACEGCRALFQRGQGLDTDEQRDTFCDGVVNLVLRVLNNNNKWAIRINNNRDTWETYCNEFLQCPTTPGDMAQATACCQTEGMCDN